MTEHGQKMSLPFKKPLNPVQGAAQKKPSLDNSEAKRFWKKVEEFTATVNGVDIQDTNEIADTKRKRISKGGLERQADACQIEKNVCKVSEKEVEQIELSGIQSESEMSFGFFDLLLLSTGFENLSTTGEGNSVPFDGVEKVDAFLTGLDRQNIWTKNDETIKGDTYTLQNKKMESQNDSFAIRATLKIEEVASVNSKLKNPKSKSYSANIIELELHKVGSFSENISIKGVNSIERMPGASQKYIYLEKSEVSTQRDSNNTVTIRRSEVFRKGVGSNDTPNFSAVFPKVSTDYQEPSKELLSFKAQEIVEFERSSSGSDLEIPVRSQDVKSEVVYDSKRKAAIDRTLQGELARVDPEKGFELEKFGAFDKVAHLNQGVVTSISNYTRVEQGLFSKSFQLMLTSKVETQQTDRSFDFQVRSMESELDISFNAKNREVFDVLSRHQSDLREFLKRSGVDDFSLKFDMDDNSESSHFLKDDSRRDERSSIASDFIANESNEIFLVSGVDRRV